MISTSVRRLRASSPEMTACNSMRLFVDPASPPDASTTLPLAGCFRMYAQPPGPGLPEQAPSVNSCTNGRAEELAADSVMDTGRSCLPFAKCNASALGVVRRNFDRHSISRDDTNEVLSHAAGDVRHHLVTDVQLHDELGVRQRFGDDTFHRNAFFFRHNSPGK